jgi:hypothetical protein
MSWYVSMPVKKHPLPRRYLPETVIIRQRHTFIVRRGHDIDGWPAQFEIVTGAECTIVDVVIVTPGAESGFNFRAGAESTIQAFFECSRAFSSDT